MLLLLQVAGGKPRATGGGGGEVYEEALPSHGDRFLHSLLTVIQRNPGQVSWWLGAGGWGLVAGLVAGGWDGGW